MAVKCHFLKELCYIVVMKFIGGGNQCTLRKSLACYKSQDDRGVSKYTLPHVGNECTTLG